MITLKAEKRDANVKAKKLRKEGYTTGVLYGKEMTEAVPLQFTSADALRFIGKNGKGSQVVLEIGDEKVDAVVKEKIKFIPVKTVDRAISVNMN